MNAPFKMLTDYMIKWLLAFKSYVHFFLSPLSPSKREGYMKKKKRKKRKKEKRVQKVQN